MTVTPQEMERSTAGRASMAFVLSAAAAPTPSHAEGMPSAIPRSQVYYWTERWQTDEAESLAELARGEGRVFGSVRDAIRWLLTDDD